MQDVLDRKRSPEYRTTSQGHLAARADASEAELGIIEDAVLDEPPWQPGRLQVGCLLCGAGLLNGTDSGWLAGWWFRNHIRTRHGKRRHLAVVPS